MICHVRWSYNLSPINHVPWKVRQVETTKESFGKSNSFPCCFDKYKKKTIPGQGNYCTPFNPWNFDIRKEYGKYEEMEGFFLNFGLRIKWTNSEGKTKTKQNNTNNITMKCLPWIEIEQWTANHVFYQLNCPALYII